MEFTTLTEKEFIKFSEKHPQASFMQTIELANLKKELQKFVQIIRQEKQDNLVLFMIGYNSLVRKGQLVLQKDIPINGLDKDHFAIKRKNLLPFKQGLFWEKFYLKKR